MAGVVGQFLANPTDLVKVQMQMEGKRKLKANQKKKTNSCIQIMEPFEGLMKWSSGPYLIGNGDT